MEKESNIFLGGALILLALIAQTIFCRGKNHFESILHHSQLFYKKFILQSKGKQEKLCIFYLLCQNCLFLKQQLKDHPPIC